MHLILLPSIKKETSSRGMGAYNEDFHNLRCLCHLYSATFTLFTEFAETKANVFMVLHIIDEELQHDILLSRALT